MIPRFTGTRFQLQAEDRMPSISQLYNQIATDDLRNHMIIDDVLNCVKEGRNCLVLSERKQHVVLALRAAEQAEGQRNHFDGRQESEK